MRAVLIDYGAGNLQSVAKALDAAGLPPERHTEPAAAAGADVLVLPGQGHFGQVAASFAASGFAPLVRDHLAADRPFLGICVGLQLLMDGSDEAPDAAGLGLLRGRARRFPADGPSVPHMGWNFVEPFGESKLLEGLEAGFHAYFAHAYYVRFEDADLPGGRTRYGDVTFASAISRGNLHATQFHPEKSQRAGLAVLRNFARAAHAARPARA